MIRTTEMGLGHLTMPPSHHQIHLESNRDETISLAVRPVGSRILLNALHFQRYGGHSRRM